MLSSGFVILCIGPWQIIQGIVEFGVWKVALNAVLLIEYWLRAIETFVLLSVVLFDRSALFVWQPPVVL